ncbi:MAG TPA: hypothetical protein VL129_01005 [Pseudomonas sp.]|uniref:hypothetical protein n=1 Tax=Pseudomonas sp. TaxID=306 RepID=UPI002C5CFA1A|nr:hypothetical protein [Pseudomonas sp.]HTO17714.1 hypothetical protein [Pseudomonas sp.]
MSSTQITVSIQLSPTQAEAYLSWVVRQYELAMTEVWYSDRYRNVPEGLRGQAVLRDHPYIAGLNRTARELRRQVAA